MSTPIPSLFFCAFNLTICFLFLSTISFSMLCGSWYLRTSPLSELYVSPLLASSFRCYHCNVDPGIPGLLHCRRCLFTLSFDFFISFRSCVDPDISGHLHCRIFRHYVHLRCQSCVDPYCKDISTVGHQIPMLRGP